MNNSILSGSFPFPIAEEKSQILSWLLEQINIFSVQDNLIDELSQIFQIVDFQLGDLISSPSDLSSPQNQKEYNLRGKGSFTRLWFFWRSATLYSVVERWRDLWWRFLFLSS